MLIHSNFSMLRLMYKTKANGILCSLYLMLLQHIYHQATSKTLDTGFLSIKRTAGSRAFCTLLLLYKTLPAANRHRLHRYLQKQDLKHFFFSTDDTSNLNLHNYQEHLMFYIKQSETGEYSSRWFLIYCLFSLIFVIPYFLPSVISSGDK